MRLSALLPLLALMLALPSPALHAQANVQTLPSTLGNVRVTTLATGLAHPWGLAFLPDGNLLVTERPGRLRVVTPQGGVSTALAGVPAVFAQGQGGLLDVAFGPDGFLYVTSGDNFSNATAQRQNQHQGKILRLRTDGSAAPGNPFLGNSAWRPEIWSTGHRSPQGLAFHPLTGQLWMTEHGPQGGDELNRIGRGLNYGWPTITFGIGYDGRPIPEAVGSSAPGLEQPQHHWTPSIGTSGLAFYAHPRAPEWIGSVFVGGLVSRSLHRLRLDANDRVIVQEQLLSGLNWRIRDVRVGAAAEARWRSATLSRPYP